MCESWYTPKSEQRYQWKVLAVVLFLHRVSSAWLVVEKEGTALMRE